MTHANAPFQSSGSYFMDSSDTSGLLRTRKSFVTTRTKPSGRGGRRASVEGDATEGGRVASVATAWAALDAEGTGAVRIGSATFDGRCREASGVCQDGGDGNDAVAQLAVTRTSSISVNA